MNTSTSPPLTKWPGGFAAGDIVANYGRKAVVAKLPALHFVIPGHVPVDFFDGNGVRWAPPAALGKIVAADRNKDSEFRQLRVPYAQHPGIKSKVNADLRRINKDRMAQNLKPIKMHEWMIEAIVEKLGRAT